MLPVSCLGVGFVSTWTELAFINPPIVYSGVPSNFFSLFNLGTIVMASAIAVCMRKHLIHRALVSNFRNLFLTLVLLLFSTSINFIATLLELNDERILMASALIGGVGLALLFIMWFEVISHLSPTQLLLGYSLAAIGRVSLIWLCAGMSIDRLWVCLCGVAVLAVLTLWFARNAVSKNAPVIVESYDNMDSDSNPIEGTCSFPIKPLLVVLTGTLALSFMLGIGGNAWGTNGNPGVLVAGVVVVGIVLFKGDFFEFKWLWQGSVICMIAAIAVFVGSGTDTLLLGGFFVCISYELCLMLMYSILGDLVYRSFYNSTFLFSVEVAIALTAGYAGSIASGWVEELISQYSILMLALVGGVMALLFVIASINAFSKRGLNGNWSAIIRKPIAQDIDLSLERSRLGLRCHDLAQEAGLSRREEEVLLLLAQKKKPSAIAKQLTIEVSTVNTHKKHIYSKLDVHSAKQLQTRIGSIDGD